MIISIDESIEAVEEAIIQATEEISDAKQSVADHQGRVKLLKDSLNDYMRKLGSSNHVGVVVLLG